jgi:hypothetical protein
MKFSLEHDRWDRLVLIDEDGRRFEDVAPVRAFPLSAPDRSITICDADGRELIYIDRIENLDEPVRSVLEAELAGREFLPLILRILNTPGETEPSTWTVQTDRGVVTFELDGDDSVHRHDAHGLSIVDSQGIRYEVPDVRKLDSHSRRVLEVFL